ncbi:hypothetical protein FJ651_01470 [Paucihalobacter ruber]|uniref:Transporter n=1 Tax=Paucihalobacter ruber TaxID=2567861 RepID=A0A506PQQ8_9FLAO|nr:hypothetical protein [Paucihalobacter ruber]TPV35607.1 hypothetical protein FJ651_01470 [Paucihalobacter ruber]
MKKIIITIFCVITTLATAQEVEKLEAAELAKKLANPIASLISVPFQNNTDLGIGELNGSRNTLNIQPVVPISVTDNLNLITRWVQPVISQYNITGEGNHEFGLGDAVISAFLSPSNSKGGLTWGAGPVFLVPTGTNSFLTAEKFGIGPTAIALYQSNGITIGALVNQIWSVAGDDNRIDVNQLFFQPFFTYNWKSGAGLGANLEVTQNWETSNTSVWLNPVISGLSSLGNLKTQFLFGPRINLAAANGAKADFGIRAGFVFLFAK